MDQFIYESNDEYTFASANDLQTAKLVSALVTLEHEAPGTLKHMLRIASLVNDRWRISSTVSNRERSLTAQSEFDKWLLSN